MGKLNGFIRPEGTFGGLTFYKTADGHYVREKGGVSKNRIMNDPAFARTRENLNEFGMNAKAGKLLRASVGIILHKAKDSKLSSRMQKVMNAIKNLDNSSLRGQRKVSIGIQTEAGKQLLKNFDFNEKSKLANVLQSPYTLDRATGAISIKNFSTQEQITAAEGATHINFRSAFIDLDFETGIYECHYSPESTIAISPELTTVDMIPTEIPSRNNTKLHLLTIEFLQQVNGVLYPLNNTNNVLNIIDVSGD